MKKHLAVATIAIMAFGLANSVFAAKKSNQTMSFGFVQEFAGVANNGEIRVDLINNSTNYPQHIRIGAFGGEVMVDTTNLGGATATGLGYKHPVNPNLAIYGKFYLNTATGGQTNLTAGVSYTGNSGNFIFNGNGHFTNATALNTSTFFLNGAAFYKLKTKSLPGSMQLGGEIALQLSPSPTTTNLFIGARWAPKRTVFVDLGIAASAGGTTSIQTPAFVRLNLRSEEHTSELQSH